MTLIGLKRPHDLINLPCSFQLNCLHQVVLFIEKQEYSLIKVLEICFVVSGCPILHKVGNTLGVKTSKLGVLGVYHSWKTGPETG